MRLYRTLTSLILMLCLSFTFCACGKDNGDENPGNTIYTVTVKNAVGAPESDVEIYVHRGESDFNVVALPKCTDSEGKAVFELPTASDYSVQLNDVHERYAALDGNTLATRYTMGEKGVEIRLEYNEAYVPTVYSVGDRMPDFTLTDIQGNTYSLTKLLETKKMVMLNFWFTKCPPCAAEFPYVNAAYAKYKDSIEILAVDDYYYDTASDVASYSDNKGFGLEFPLFYNYGLNNNVKLGKFGSSGYPTTVIIDRYGVICMIEVGAVTSASAWDNLFAYFTSESYNQRFFEDIQAVPQA